MEREGEGEGGKEREGRRGREMEREGEGGRGEGREEGREGRWCPLHSLSTIVEKHYVTFLYAHNKMYVTHPLT